MASDTAQVKPTNKIVWDSVNEHRVTKKVETATNVYPGRLVKRGTNDDDIVVNTDNNADIIGWAGYEQTHKNYRPATVDTIYTVNDQAVIVYGPGLGVVASLASGQNVTEGTLLMATSSGELSGATVGTHHVVARAAESVDQSGGDSGDIMVVSLI